jgi:hypothetical protein
MMVPIITLLAVAIVSMVIGILIGRFAFVTARRSDALGYGLIGFVVGTLIGLSNTPVLAAAISAGVAVATSLLSRIGKDHVLEGLPGAMNQWRAEWLAPLAGAMLVGLVFGVAVRANDLLNFKSSDLRLALRAQGFSQPQVEAIMAKIASEITYDATKKAADNSRSFIQSYGLDEK